MLPGYATLDGTARYRDRFPNLRDAAHFRRADAVPGAGELWVSSLGLGTYLGEPDAATDRRYTESAEHALGSGINLLDTAINYRHQRSERNLGAALARLVAEERLQRDEVVVCTKAGYLPFDAEMPADPRAYFVREYLDRGVFRVSDIAGGMHCMAPTYLADQLERSRRNLGLATLDVFYLHNPETQLSAVDRSTFRQRLKDAFTMLEDAVRAGSIRYYGCATWNAFRLPPAEHGSMSLAETVAIAREVAGDAHHFRFVQMPFNLAMIEAWAFRNQRDGERSLSLLELAQQLGVAVVGSASLHQGQLTAGLPASLVQSLGATEDTHAALQFARSAPGLLTALIGMSAPEHVAANLQVAIHPPLSAETWKSLFREEAE
ncbi:MAG TPA: aldo/keto reductase [Terriglobales bacterium]|nr:aldo/keto reductase [Terriglobales bacterium]